MKSLIALAFVVVSFSTFSNDLGSVDSFLSIIQLGDYSGVDNKGSACSISVREVNFPAKALSVTITNSKAKIFKILNDGSEFLFKADKLEFTQIERQLVDATRTSYIDRIIKTVNAGDQRLYVVVANEITINRDRTVEAVECVVELK